MGTYWIRLVCATVWAIMVANGECQSALTSFFNPYTNQQEIVYIGTDQNVSMIYYTPGSQNWASQNMTTASGATVQPASRSALASFFNPYANQQEIAYVGTDQNVHLIYYTPDFLAWADQNITTASSATVQPALGSALTSFFNPYTNQQEIVYIGTDQNVHLIYYTPGSLAWADQNMTAASGATVQPALGSALTSFFNPYTNQ